MIQEVGARNVELSTVPNRQTIQLTIYNSEDLTLVRETRVVTFKAGINPLQFSWANTLIDPTSVELTFRADAAHLEILDTTFPHDKPQMLYWNVMSDTDREAMIEISYFTSGITWSADYTAITNPDETLLNLDAFVRVKNNSGEDYENAQVRLVVGTINLVEKIAQLARVPIEKVGELQKDELAGYRQRAAKSAMMPAAPAPMAEMLMSADAAVTERPKEIYKEGLSEYFIYTVEGTETIPNGWAKRLRSFTAEEIPLKVHYRYREREYGDQLVRLYILTNDTASKLGTTPLPDGTVRIFRNNGLNGLSYLASQTIKYIPVGDKIELNLGVDPNVLFELVPLKYFRTNIWMRYIRGNIYKRVGDANIQIEVDSEVAGWDHHTVFSQRIRNYSGRPIDVEIRRTYTGDITFRSSLNPKLHDFRTVEWKTQLAPGERRDLLHEIIQRQGYNQKQDRVELEAGAVRF